jgi:ATP-binding cassette subfamily F protein uup
LFEGLDLRLDPRERLGIVGPNGAGKTTLLRILAGTRPPDEGVVTVGSTVRTGLFSQDAAEIDPDARVRDLVTRGKKEVSWQDNALMERFWFDTDSQWAPAGTLSGGERRRLQLLLVLLEQPNVLLLDEPTNDLDLDTLRLLEDFLDDWPGALVVVSHDRALLQRTVVDVLVIDGGVAARRPGGLGSYLEQRRAGRVRGKAEARAAEAPRSTRTAPSTLRRDFNAAERALAKVTAFRDAAVRDLEATPGTDHARLVAIGQRVDDAQRAVEDAEERWLELAQLVEESNPGLL